MKLTCLLAVILLLLLPGCRSKKEKKNTADIYKLDQPLTKLADYDEGFPLTDEPIDKDAPYKTEEYKKNYSDYYKDKIAPPPFNFNIDLSNKTFKELRLLRSEILARHGFLFMDYVLRSHFNATRWYQPVFWDDKFKIHLSDEEKGFIAKVLQLEQEQYKKNYIGSNGIKKANIENVVNREQFEKLPEEMVVHLQKDGFVINKAEHEQLFHVYDENYYDYTPSFITTDLYLQVLHMHISKEMQSIEQEEMIPIVTDLIKDQIGISKKTAASTKDPSVKKKPPNGMKCIMQ